MKKTFTETGPAGTFTGEVIAEFTDIKFRVTTRIIETGDQKTGLWYHIALSNFSYYLKEAEASISAKVRSLAYNGDQAVSIEEILKKLGYE